MSYVIEALCLRLADFVEVAAKAITKALDVVFPEPADDLMAVAEAAGVTVEQQEQRDYHLAMCEIVELAARNRAPHTEADFEAWRIEYATRGEQ